MTNQINTYIHIHINIHGYHLFMEIYDKNIEYMNSILFRPIAHLVIKCV